MPRRKITIAEAMGVLRENNLDVSVKIIEDNSLKPAVIKKTEKAVVRKVGNTAVTIMLRNQHVVGCGGFMIRPLDGGEPTTTNNTSVTYGPGQVTVPVAIASDLLYQDQLMQRAEERFRETTQRSYLVTQRRSNDGSSVANVAVEVSNGVMDAFSVNSKETMVI